MISIRSRRSLLKLASIIAPMGATALPIKLLGFSSERTQPIAWRGVH